MTAPKSVGRQPGEPFDPEGVAWTRVSPRLARARRVSLGIWLGLLALAAVAVAWTVLATHGSPTGLISIAPVLLLLGPLLHRTGEAFVPLVGGDPIGRRPVDFHIQALTALGAEIEVRDDGIVAKRPSLDEVFWHHERGRGKDMHNLNLGLSRQGELRQVFSGLLAAVRAIGCDYNAADAVVGRSDDQNWAAGVFDHLLGNPT